MQKLAYSMCNKKYIIKNNQKPSYKYIPQICVKLKGWNPPPASKVTEDNLTNFQILLKEAISCNTNSIKFPFTNLTLSQRATLNKLR
jgi:hypothetical protein